MASPDRALAFRNRCLSLAKTCSMGLRSGRVFGQEEELGAGRADKFAHGFALMTAEIVHDNNVASAKRRHQDPCHIGAKALAIDRPLKKPRRIDPIEAERGQEGRRVPATMRDLGDAALAARRPSAQWSHVGLGPGLVDEDKALRRDAILILCPLRPPPRHVGTIAFASHHAFF